MSRGRHLTRAGSPRNRGHRGTVVLPVVVLLSSAAFAAAGASFELAVAAARRAANVDDHLLAAASADAALMLCVRAYDAGVAPWAAPSASGPLRWRDPSYFDRSGVFEPVSNWSGGARPPQCLVERWQLAQRPQAAVHVVTARGFGMLEGTQAWLQWVVIRERGMEKRHWRRIVARQP